MSQFKSNRFQLILLLLLLILLLPMFFIDATPLSQTLSHLVKPLSPAVPSTPSSSPSPTPTSTPTPKPLSFTQMNALYGPCAKLPTLMYHHIQTREAANDKKQTAFTVYTDIFASQMEYLKSRGYATVSMADLTAFFDSGASLPQKSALLTFDDAYADFATDAFPVLKTAGQKATVFTPTGLVNNPNYLSWSTISDIAASGLVAFANHTWSHKNVNGNREIIVNEITVADTQLAERGLNSPKVFAYPYGADNLSVEALLADKGYKLAFTTRPGSILCAGKRYSLPRVRIGNSQLSAYGL